MFVKHLSLTNFRNYIRLELDLPPSISVFQGDNAQGKTNLLEAICFLATTRFSRATAERELINWAAMREQMPFARLSAKVEKGGRNLQLQVVLRPKPAVKREGRITLAPIQKHIQINGVARRVVDLVGQLNMVMFSPRDIDLIGGEPALRRRYLDITNSQVSPQYLRALQRYNKVLTQRNYLLHQIAAHQAKPNELAFWDQELVVCGSYITFQRMHTIAKLNELAEPVHNRLSGGRERLNLVYRKNIGKGIDNLESPQRVEQIFREALDTARGREIARGVSLVGPHRDDLRFLVNEVNMGTYGSRGQQRTIALSLRLAEARFMLTQTEEPPVLLLDDVLSELDVERRHHLLEAVLDYQQVMITTTDLDRFPPDFLSRAAKFKVEDGKIDRWPV